METTWPLFEDSNTKKYFNYIHKYLLIIWMSIVGIKVEDLNAVNFIIYIDSDNYKADRVRETFWWLINTFQVLVIVNP